MLFAADTGDAVAFILILNMIPFKQENTAFTQYVLYKQR